MQKFYLLIHLLLWAGFTMAQPKPEIEWTWVSGSSSPDYKADVGLPENLMPSGRAGAVSFMDSKSGLWLFSGITCESAYTNDLWIFDKGKSEWRRMHGDNSTNSPGVYGKRKNNSIDHIPGARMSAVSWTGDDGSFYIFGGYGLGEKKEGGFGYLNDLWRYNPGKGWAWMSGSNAINTIGSYKKIDFADDANSPSARRAAANWIDDDGNLWLWGGEGLSADSKLFGLLSDLWMYDIKKEQWIWKGGSLFENVEGNYGASKGVLTPGARHLATTWKDRTGNFWLMGGNGFGEEKNTKGLLNDLWLFDMGKKNWQWIGGKKGPGIPGEYGTMGVVSSSNYPGSRCGAVAWNDKDNKTWMFGGMGNVDEKNIGYLNDLWTYDAANKQWTWVSGSNQIDKTGIYGTKGVADVKNIAGGRSQHINWFDNDGLIWLFGGFGFGDQEFGRLNDLWLIGKKSKPEPVITLSCPGSQTAYTSDSTCNAQVLNIDPILSSPADIIVELRGDTKNDHTRTASGLFFNKGITTVTYKLAKNPGISCSFTVTVLDKTAPVPVVKQLQDIVADCAVTVTNFPEAIDACGGKIKAKTESPLEYNQPGNYKIVWRYEDAAGNIAEQSQNVEVKNASGKLQPLLTALPDIIGGCSAEVKEVPKASAGCGETVDGKTTDPLKYTKQGSYIITWQFIYGNEVIKQTQRVIVKDSLSPVPATATLKDIKGSCLVKVTEVPTANDDCAGTIKGTTKDKLQYDAPGTYTITWLYDDGNGNTSQQTQKVIVSQATTLTPLLDELPDITGECSVTITTKPQAAAGCGNQVLAATTDPLQYNNQGSYTITWKYVSGNSSITQKQKVIVKDTKAPVPATATLKDIKGSCSVKVTEVPTANDDCAGTIKGTTKDKLQYDAPGTYTITWLYDDGNGNTSEQTQKVMVSQATTLTPLLDELPDITGECSVTITTKPQAAAGCGNQVLGTTTDPLQYNNQGSYTITWKYISGNSSITQKQKVIVKDSKAPVPVKNMLADIKGTCEIVVNEIPEARDACAGTIRATTTDPLKYEQPGEYIINWIYKDGNGNQAAQQQRVILADLSDAPKLLKDTLQSVEGECFVNVLVKPIAQDVCLGVIIGSTTDPLTYTEPGTYTIRWKFAGKQDTIYQHQQVIVKTRLEAQKVYPNPTQDQFSVMLSSCKQDEMLNLVVYDVLGRLVERRQAQPNKLLNFGVNYPPGTYYLSYMQGNEKKMLRLVKR